MKSASVENALSSLKEALVKCPEGVDTTSWLTEQLAVILGIAEQTWREEQDEGNKYEHLRIIAKGVADLARDERWRAPSGRSGLLGFYITHDLLTTAPGEDLKRETLRLIGNSCAECDENKTRLLESGTLKGPILSLFDDKDSLLPFVISVLYNITIENDEAQRQVSEAGLSKKLVDVLSGPRLSSCRNSLGLITQLMTQLVSQDVEPKVANPSSPATLLRLAINEDVVEDAEEFADLCTVALAYLTYEQFQSSFLSSSNFPLLQDGLYDSYARFEHAIANDSDVTDQFKQVWNAAVTIFADISALSDFATLYPISSPVTQRFITWLSSPPSHTHAQTAACLALGNLCRSDETSLALIPSVLSPLVAILSRSITPGTPTTHVPPAQLLHAVLGLLKNLAIPTANKSLLSAALLDAPSHTLPHLWTTTTAQPQVQFAAISLTRLLLTANPPGVAQLCNPAFTLPYTTRDGPARSNFHILMDIAFRADAEPTKMEAARAVCAVIRVLQAPTTKTSVLVVTWDWGASVEKGGEDTARARFYAAHSEAIAQTLGGLLTQTKFPALRSEALFVLALMGRSVDGGKVALKTLELEEACRALLGVVVGADSGVTGEEKGEGKAAPSIDTGLIDGLSLEPQQIDIKQSAGTAKRDRENGLVLVAEILRGFSAQLTDSRKTDLKAALSQGGELLLAERKKT